MKVLLIDDHPLILPPLKTVIQGLGDHVSVVGAASAAEARGVLAADPDFDLVLLDLALGDAHGFDVLTEFRAQYPAVPVVVVSASDPQQRRDPRRRPGAMGFVPKRASNEILFGGAQRGDVRRHLRAADDAAQLRRHGRPPAGAGTVRRSPWCAGGTGAARLQTPPLARGPDAAPDRRARCCCRASRTS